MKEALKETLSNLAGRFVHLFNLGHAEESLELFTENAALALPLFEGGKSFSGKAEIRNAFEEKDRQFWREGRVIYHFLHTPILKIAPRQESAEGIWMTFTFLEDRSEQTMEPIVCRIVFSFIPENEIWKIQEVSHQIFTSIAPFHEKGNSRNLQMISDAFGRNREKDLTCRVNDADYREIQNLQSHYIYDQGENLKTEFCEKGEVSFQEVFLKKKASGVEEIRKAIVTLETIVRNNGGSAGWYGLMTPYIAGSIDGETAEGFWNTFGFIIRGKGYGAKEETVSLEPVIGLLHQTFQKENGTWKFKTFHHEQIAYLDDWMFTPGRPSGSNKENIGLIQLKGEGEWKKPDWMQQGSGSPEEYWEIEEIESYDISYLNSGRTGDFPKRFFSEKENDVKAWISSPQAKEITGYEQIIRLFEAFEKLREKQGNAQSVHSSSTPFISILEDGTEAIARWLDIGWTVHGSGMGNQTPPFPVVPVFGMYEHRVVKENAHWKLKRYSFYSMIQIHHWLTDPEKSRGWSAGDREHPWPLP